MTLSEMRQLLIARGIQLTKSLGQNFLHDGNQLRRLVAAAELKPADRVLEIGPGLGPLTELLLSQAAEVLAIEKDARLVEILRERFNVGQASSLSPSKERPLEGSLPTLRLVHADALELIHSSSDNWSRWKLVANLPYSAASAILVELAATLHPPERIVTTLQLEVAQRLRSQAGDEDYGVLSLLVQLRYKPGGLFKIPSSCFFPPPDVESVCLRLDRRAHELLPIERHRDFTGLVKLAFSQRRKMMIKLLKSNWPEAVLADAFAQLGISPQTRAETVSLRQFAALTEILYR